MRRRVLLFVVIAAFCLGGAGAYLLHAMRRTAPHAGGTPFAPRSPGETVSGTPPPGSPGTAPPPGPVLVFRRTSIDRDNGALDVAPVADPASARFVPMLRCECLHMAEGMGVCLAADRGVFTTYRVVLFDEAFTPGTTLPLAGVPSC